MTDGDRLNGRSYFHVGLMEVLERLEKRHYVSTYQFSTDLATTLANVISIAPLLPTLAPDDEPFDERAWRAAVTSEQKEKRRLAKRILKAVEPMLKDVNSREADLLKKSVDEMPELNIMEVGLPLKDPPIPSPAEAAILVQAQAINNGEETDVAMHDATEEVENRMELDHELTGPDTAGFTDSDEKKQASPPSHPTPDTSATSHAAENSSFPLPNVPEPPTPPLSHASASLTGNALVYGGTPWYMNAFSPEGTTIFEEKWTGRDVARELSEELSDMGDEELAGLKDDADIDGIEEPAVTVVKGPPSEPSPAKGTTKGGAKSAKKGKAKKRYRGFR